MIDVPAVVRNKAVNVGAEAWLDALPRLVSGLEREWGITAGAAYDSSTEAVVLDATCADGTPAVLKLCVPRDAPAAELEIMVLRVADGDGCVRLLRDGVDRGALLLERLGPMMFSLGLPIGQRLPLLCDAAQRMWRPAPDGHRFTTGAAKGRSLLERIVATWEQLGRPCAERTIAHAVACAERRVAAHDDDRARLVHGDVHQWNALRADDGSFKLIDPDGLVAEPEYDLGVLMREDPTEGDLDHRADWLAARTGLDRTAIWEWGVVERVSTGLLGVAVDLRPVADEMLAAADRISVGADR